MPARVSICMPTYNARPDYLRRALASALAQNYDSFEIIVSENHTSNGADAVLNEFCDPRMRVVRPPRYLGIADNFNFCVSHAQGEYMCVLPSDDMLHPDFCAKLSAVLDRHPDAVWASCAFVEIDEQGRELKIVNEVAETSVFRPGKEELRRYVFGPVHNFVASMMRTAAYRAAGGLDPKLWRAGDWDIDLTMLRQGSVAHLPEPLCFYRNWKSQVEPERLLAMPGLTADVYEKHERAGTFSSLPPAMVRKARKRWAIAMMYRLSAHELDSEARRAAVQDALRLDRSFTVRLRAWLISAGLKKVVVGWRDARMTAGRWRRLIF
ncbi:MAG TPA: glycosyltransferase [Terriglobales bacterium]|nr:glycosyltransferase [Terriglobales bacterium]